MTKPGRIWNYFFKDKISGFGFLVVLFISLFGIFAPVISPHNPYTQILDFRNKPPGFTGEVILYRLEPDLPVYTTAVKSVTVHKNTVKYLDTIDRTFEIDLINMKKYRLMHSKFLHTGNHGPWMMRNTASVQINIDVTSKKDAEEMAFIADCLQPLSSILFSNSPFLKGKPAGKENLRYKIWNDTDSIRCNYLLDHNIESIEGLIKKYCEYVQKVPAIFVKDTNNSIQEHRETLGGWLAGLEKRNQIRDEHILTVLRQIFTHVRFKHVLEVRGCDRPPCGYEMTPVSFWVGLLCADVSRKSILAMLKNWTIEERKQLNNSAQHLDISRNGPQGKPIREWLEKVCAFSLEGLEERQKKPQIKNEFFLLEEFIDDFFKNGPKGLQTQEEFLSSGHEIVEFIKSNCPKD